MNDILTYMDKLGELDTTGVPPTNHALELTGAFREDEVRPSLERERGLANAPGQRRRELRGPQGRVRSPSMELHEMTIAQAREMLDRKEISSLELTEAILARVEATEPAISAYLTVTAESARAQAAAADKLIAAGQAGPLTGIPAGIKGRDLHRKTCAPPQAAASWRTTCRPTTPPWWPG